MPRIKLSEAEEQKRFLGRVICSNMQRYGITRENLTKRAGICKSTHFKRVSDPDTMTLGELKIYIHALHISDEDLLYALKGEKSEKETH